MITAIKLKNFQCHESLNVEFTDGVNLIVGSSNKGKSAILRALRLALWNNLSGDGYVKHGKTSTAVMVNVDGHEILRTRKGKTNEYQVDKLVLKAIGSSALDQVTEIHRINEEISFQGQHDPAFMIAWSPSSLFQTLNSIVGFESIDKAVKIAKKEYQDFKDQILSMEKDLKSFKEQRDSLSKVPEQLEALNSIQIESKKLEEMDSTLDAIGRLVCLVRDVEGDIHVYKDKEEKVNDLSKKYTEQKAVSENIKRLKDYLMAINVIVEYKAKEEASKAIVDVYKKQVLACQEMESIYKVKGKYLSAKDVIYNMNDKEVMLLEDGQRFNGFCPECGKEGFVVG